MIVYGGKPSKHKLINLSIKLLCLIIENLYFFIWKIKKFLVIVK